MDSRLSRGKLREKKIVLNQGLRLNCGTSRIFVSLFHKYGIVHFVMFMSTKCVYSEGNFNMFAKCPLQSVCVRYPNNFILLL